jgi:hypothetical protein
MRDIPATCCVAQILRCVARWNGKKGETSVLEVQEFSAISADSARVQIGPYLATYNGIASVDRGRVDNDAARTPTGKAHRAVRMFVGGPTMVRNRAESPAARVSAGQ